MASGKTALTSHSPKPRVALYEQAPALDVVPSNENAAQPGAIAHRLMAVVAWVERKNSRFAFNRGETFLDCRRFPWVGELEQNWTVIRSEVARLMMHKDHVVHDAAIETPWLEQDRVWKTVPLANYGSPAQNAADQCPETWRLLQKVPGLISAMFSILEPGRHLPPHRGPYNGLLRLHLGLIVPELSGQIGIRVRDESRHWEEGQALIFDDTLEHEAWNDTNQTRVILFLDFVRPLRFPARVLNWLVLHSFAFRPFIREGLHGARWWERRFYREAQTIRQSRAADQSPSAKPAQHD